MSLVSWTKKVPKFCKSLGDLRGTAWREHSQRQLASLESCIYESLPEEGSLASGLHP